MGKRILVIENCDQCPNFKSSMWVSGNKCLRDGLDKNVKWDSKEGVHPIPDWCPLPIALKDIKE